MTSSGRPTNPAFSDQPFKIGMFAYLHRGGMALTKAPERWQANWPDILKFAQMADNAGMDYLIPISSWKGWKGEIDQRRWSFETLTHAAGLAAATNRIAIYSTVHAPLVHPVFAAKALTTIDHISGGRAGLNIVCGWNKADFDMFGQVPLEHDERYAHGAEWHEILTRILRDGQKDFDYKGKYFDLKNVSGEPLSIQRPHPAIVSAAFSPVGRDFAIRTSDQILTMTGDYDTAHREVDDIREREAKVVRARPLDIIASVSICCRETRKEAEEFDRYVSVDMADHLAVDQFTTVRAAAAAEPPAQIEARRRGVAGGARLVGTPEDIVEGLLKLKKAGFNGAALVTVNYLADMPLIAERLLPEMEKAGLRTPMLRDAA